MSVITVIGTWVCLLIIAYLHPKGERARDALFMFAILYAVMELN